MKARNNMPKEKTYPRKFKLLKIYPGLKRDYGRIKVGDIISIPKEKEYFIKFPEFWKEVKIGSKMIRTNKDHLLNPGLDISDHIEEYFPEFYKLNKEKWMAE